MGNFEMGKIDWVKQNSEPMGNFLHNTEFLI